MSEELKESLVKAGYKVLIWAGVIAVLDYFVDIPILDKIKDLGLISWILLYGVFVLSNFIQLKYKKD